MLKVFRVLELLLWLEIVFFVVVVGLVVIVLGVGLGFVVGVGVVVFGFEFSDFICSLGLYFFSMFLLWYF